MKAQKSGSSAPGALGTTARWPGLSQLGARSGTQQAGPGRIARHPKLRTRRGQWPGPETAAPGQDPSPLSAAQAIRYSGRPPGSLGRRCTCRLPAAPRAGGPPRAGTRPHPASPTSAWLVPGILQAMCSERPSLATSPQRSPFPPWGPQASLGSRQHRPSLRTAGREPQERRAPRRDHSFENAPDTAATSPRCSPVTGAAPSPGHTRSYQSEGPAASRPVGV